MSLQEHNRSINTGLATRRKFAQLGDDRLCRKGTNLHSHKGHSFQNHRGAYLFRCPCAWSYTDYAAISNPLISGYAVEIILRLAHKTVGRAESTFKNKYNYMLATSCTQLGWHTVNRRLPVPFSHFPSFAIVPTISRSELLSKFGVPQPILGYSPILRRPLLALNLSPKHGARLQPKTDTIKTLN